jgi:phosphate transport system substrate-binding protein
MLNISEFNKKSFFIGFLAVSFWVSMIGNLFAEQIVARGSDSTINVVQVLAKAFQEKGGVSIKVEGGGSSKGAKACLAGQVSLAFMSRAPKSKETGAGLVAMAYAIDGVAVIVNADNPISDIKLDMLKAIYIGKMTKWDSGKPVMAINRPATSGTREVFQNKVLGKGVDFSPRILVKHDKAAQVTVSKAVTAVAFTSAGALSDQTNLKVLTVNGVAPTSETLRNGTYPIARTLHFATKGTPFGKVKEFLDFVQSNEGQQIITQAGFVTLR